MFAGKKCSKGILAVVLAIAIAFAPGLLSSPVQAATSLSQMQSKLADLKKQQTEADEKLKKLKEDKTQKLAYKDTLVSQMNNVQGQIDVLNSQISTLNANIKTKSAEISAKQTTIEQNTEKLKQRVRALYLMGDASGLEIILNAKNIVDFADKAEMLRSITAHDTQLINTLKSDINSIQQQKKDIEASRTKVAAAKTELDTKNSELDSIVKETQAAVAEISAGESTTSAEKEKLAQQAKEEEAAVDQWYQAYYANLKAQEEKRKSEAEKQAQNSSKPSSNSGSGSSSGSTSGDASDPIGTGKFTWPTPALSVITTQFGELDYRGIPHKGIDIAGGNAVYGSSIVAADSGTVMFSAFGTSENYHYGYGNVVQIDHHNGYSTLYAHCSVLCVSEGQQVTKGQKIAEVGNTGNSFGAHLHFEIRLKSGYYGEPQNPRQWFHY